MAERMTGAEMVIQALTDQGVEHIFGYPGGAALPIYDAMFQQDVVKHILVRHEQGATHMAEGYARSTGKPGVVLVTSGPGATNAVTGLIALALATSVSSMMMAGPRVYTRMAGDGWLPRWLAPWRPRFAVPAANSNSSAKTFPRARSINTPSRPTGADSSRIWAANTTTDLDQSRTPPWPVFNLHYSAVCSSVCCRRSRSSGSPIAAVSGSSSAAC